MLKVSDSIIITLQKGCSIDPEVGKQWVRSRLRAILSSGPLCSMYFIVEVEGHYLLVKCKLVYMRHT